MKLNLYVRMRYREYGGVGKRFVSAFTEIVQGITQMT